MIEVGHIQMSDETASLFEALAKAQALYKPVSKDRTVDIQSDKARYTYNYATLDAIWEEVRPHLTANGICTIQSPHTDGNDVTVTTLLGHASGQWVSGSVTLKATKPDAQGAGSALSYCRRYSLQGVVCVTPESDDDASSAVGLGASASINSKKPKTTCPKCGKQTIIKGKEEFGGGWLCWKKEGKSDGCGEKFDTDPALAVTTPPPTDAIGEWGTKLQEFIRGKLEHPTAPAANAWLFKETNGTDKDAVKACQDEEHAKLLYETFAERETLI